MSHTTDTSDLIETKFEDVLKELEEFSKKDIPYERVLSSMCTNPHPIAIKAHKMFIRSNLGDPGIFPGTAELEKKLIKILGKLFNNPKCYGYITSGGTEGNIQAIRAARNYFNLKKPNIVVPSSAHFSFNKICDLLKVEVKKAKLDDSYKVDISDVEKLVDENTFALVGIAGTTELGQIDDIQALSEIATENDLFLHVDAAFGGFVIPFLDLNCKFDFSVEGVSSIVADPHKMGLATIPAGCLLFRDEEIMETLCVETPYLTSSKQFTLTGTRPGTGVASSYAVLKHLGYNGLKVIVKKCMKLTSILTQEMESIGFERVIDPVLNVVCFHCKKAEKIKDELYKKGWVISTIRKPKAIRCVVMPHLNEELISEFVRDVKVVLKKS